MDIFNYQQLESEMNKICEDVINTVSTKMLDNLKDVIMRDVYLSHPINRVYIPTYEFLNSFQWENIVKNTKNISKTLFYNWMEMRSDPTKFIHAQYPSGEDTREILADILNINGIDTSSPIGVERHAYFNEYLTDMFLGGHILQLFDDAFSVYGIHR